MSLHFEKKTALFFRNPEHFRIETQIIQPDMEELDEDALDRETVPFHEVEDLIAASCYGARAWSQDDDDWVGGWDHMTEVVPVGNLDRDPAEALEMAREQTLVGEYYRARL